MYSTASVDPVARTIVSEVIKPASTHAKESWCKCQKPVGRNLVVCIDGTSNQFGPKVCSRPTLARRSYLIDALILSIAEHQRYRPL